MRRAGSYLGKARWECRCDCGGSVFAVTGSLRSGNTQSCGCLKRERIAEACLTHGHARAKARHPQYGPWGAMIQRCTNKNSPSYEDYGGRGIKVCTRWRYGESDKSGFECFLADMGERPSPDHTLDRVNNDGNYEPSNCRWATGEQQRLNRRVTKIVEINGRRLPLVEACREAGLPRKRVEARLRLGWPIKRALDLQTVEDSHAR
jgi:hypothetical protein